MKLSPPPVRVSTGLRVGIFCVLITTVLGGLGCGGASRRDAPATTPPSAGAAASANDTGNPPSPVRATAAPVVAAQPAVVPVVTNSLTISGRVRLRGNPPPETEFQIDPACAQARGGRPVTTHTYVVGADAGLAEVFVHLRSGLAARKYPPPTEPVVIITIGCEFLPCVAAAQTGQRILVPNADAMLHNIQADPAVGQRSFNKAQFPNGPAPTFVFAQPELFLRFKTDVYPWMKAYVCVVEHPFFAVTDTNGVFRIPLPPPGRYELEAVHRRAGKSVQTIVVEPGRELAVEFTLEVSP